MSKTHITKKIRMDSVTNADDFRASPTLSFRIDMKNILLLSIILFLLSACDSIEDMSGMFEKQELAQSLVKEKYGWNSQLGFNMYNGQLTQVTLVLSSNEVREKTVGELETITREVVAEVFKSKP